MENNMRLIFILFLLLGIMTKVRAQTSIVRKGTMKVRKVHGKPASEQRVLLPNMETYGSDRVAKDRQQRERIDRI